MIPIKHKIAVLTKKGRTCLVELYALLNGADIDFDEEIVAIIKESLEYGEDAGRTLFALKSFYDEVMNKKK